MQLCSYVPLPLLLARYAPACKDLARETKGRGREGHNERVRGFKLKINTKQWLGIPHAYE